MNAGLWIAAVGAALFIFGLIGGKPGFGMLIGIVGLIVAGLGYAQRVLFALENKSTSND